MTPLPATEVRRRGNRIRRRNNALAAVGGLAAVAAIAVPFAVFAGNQTSSTPPQPAPAPPSVTWVQEIPAGFDLTTGMGDEQTPVTTSDEAMIIQNVCGVGWYVVPEPADQLGASMVNAGSEGGHDRHLVVFDDAEQAAAAMNQFAEAPTNCDGTYSDEGFRYEMLPAGAEESAAEDASAWVQALHDGTGLTGEGYVTVAQQVGNAILIDTAISGGVGDEAVREQGVANLLDRSQQVVDAMCAFSATGCASSEQAEDPIGEGAVPAIPADFPLADGLPTGGLDGTVPAPDPTVNCAHPAVPPKSVETAHAQWHTVSEIRDRQLLTFATQEEADRYVEAVSTVDCSPHRVTQVYSDPASGALVTVGHNENAGTVDPGLFVTSVVRVGRAVLLTQRIDEGYTWTADVDQESETLADDVGTEIAPLVDAMCTFTETGC